jgi:hypothetical protein
VTMDIQAKVALGRITADITFDVPYVAWGMRNPSTLILRVGKSVQMAIHADAALEPSQP